MRPQATLTGKPLIRSFPNGSGPFDFNVLDFSLLCRINACSSLTTKQPLARA